MKLHHHKTLYSWSGSESRNKSGAWSTGETVSESWSHSWGGAFAWSKAELNSESWSKAWQIT